MSETAAPAPAAPVDSAPAPSTETAKPVAPAAKAAPTPAPVPAKPVAKPFLERTPDGRYVARGIKVDGQVSDVEYDEQELQRTLQEGRAGQKRLKQAAEQQAKLQAAVQMMKSDPVQAMRALGIDPDHVLSQYVARQAQLEQLSPEDRAQLTLQEREKAFARERAQYQAKLEEQALDQHWKTTWEPELRAAFEEAGWGEGAEANLIALAELGQRYTEAGIDLPPRELVKLVDKETASTAVKYAQRAPAAAAANIVTAALPRLDDAALLKVLGPRLDELVKGRVAAIKAARNPATGAAPQPKVEPQPPAKREFLTPEEWQAKYRQR